MTRIWKPDTASYLPPGEGPAEHTVRGRREWDDRLGDAVNRVRVANLLAAGALGVAILAVFGYYRKAEHFVPPVVVVKDRLGDVVATIRPDAGAPPDDAAIAADLKRWVWNARSVFTDTNAMRQAILDAYNPLRDGGQAIQQLNTFYTDPPENEPFKRAQKETVEISNETALPVDSQTTPHGLRTFRLEWQEDVLARDGTKISSRPWEATITYEWAPPTDDDEVKKAPDGIWITSVRWTPR